MSHKYKVGELVKVVKNGGCNGVPIGTEFRITAHNSFNGPEPWYNGVVSGHGNKGFNESDITPVQNSREKLIEALDKAKAEVENISAKLVFVNKTGSDEFCDKEFRVYQALKQLETGGSLIEKARAIAKLVN